MRENKIAMRAELEELMSRYTGPINRNNDRIEVRCSVCGTTHVSTAHLMRFGTVCLRCGGRMQVC